MLLVGFRALLFFLFLYFQTDHDHHPWRRALQARIPLIKFNIPPPPPLLLLTQKSTHSNTNTSTHIKKKNTLKSPPSSLQNHLLGGVEVGIQRKGDPPEKKKESKAQTGFFVLMVEVKAQEKKIMRGIKGRITDKSEDNSSIKKERRIVVWSQEEDDILREQMGVHGTDSWTTIASIFKDKTPRQCRRRWYTYLNSDFKKGGWMPEEDVLLCKAQKIFGNRWTEIAKVVSGRTDNAVKNRFTTLCKKRARSEASTKENDFPFANSNNKRVMPCKRGIDSAPDDILDPKRARLQSMGVMEIHTLEDRLHVPKKTALNQSIRSPFSILVQNINKQNSTQQEINTVTDNEDGYEIRGTFLCKDDPKIAVLMQQAELLSSLALKVNEESTYQALENAWKVLEEFLNQNKDRRLNKENALDFGVILKGLRSIYNGRQNQIYAPDNYRRPELCDESSLSSECSTGSTAYQSPDNFQFREGLMNEGKAASDSSNAEFGFPFPVTPLFRSLAAGIPSPKFSESERNFIMKTLGMDSPSAMPSANPSRNSTCKRALLQHL